MARYIKANPKVAEYLHLTDVRTQLKDGNYLLWQADVLEFGSLTNLPGILDTIGGLALAPHEAREEQDGSVLRPLPQATDPRFIYTPPAATSTETPENAPQTNEENTNEGEVAPADESSSEAPENAVKDEDNDPEGDGEENTETESKEE